MVNFFTTIQSYTFQFTREKNVSVSTTNAVLMYVAATAPHTVAPLPLEREKNTQHTATGHWSFFTGLDAWVRLYVAFVAGRPAKPRRNDAPLNSFNNDH